MGKSRRPKGLDEHCNKRQELDMEWCEACECEIPKNPKLLVKHFKVGSKHKRKEKLHQLKSYFVRQGLDYFPAGTTYYCQVCLMGLPNNVDNLLHHLVKYAGRHQEGLRVEPLSFPATRTEVFIRIVKKVDFASTNDTFNEQLKCVHGVASLITMMESSPTPNSIFDLRADVFTAIKLKCFSRVALYLEKHGKNVSRSEAKGSTRLCMWGIRSAYGDIGWYVQDKHHCYGLSEQFATYVCGIPKRSYRKIFKYLESICSIEYFYGDEAKIGGGPFSSFCTSKDFNCRPHKDEDNYGHGFIFWLHEGVVRKDIEPVIFAFPKAGVSFVSKHGDVLCFQPGQYLHCTWQLQKIDFLGVTFVQKCSVYRQLPELIHLEGFRTVVYTSSDGKTKTVKTRQEFLKKKKEYQQHV